MTMKPGNATAPLDGVRVVEFCQVAAGPYCGMLLADLGADVIKVEPPQGDSMRAWPPLTGGYSENFASLNRNKRSIALNLKDPEDLAVARALIDRAHIVIENSRPGVMHRLGLDYGTVSADRPELIYCSLSAFGQTGPRASDGGFDVTVQAASGIMSVTGEADAAPVKAGVPISDFATGLYAAFTIAALLRRVSAGGRGGQVDASMLGASLGIAALQTSEYFGTGKDPQKLGSAHPRNAPYQAFQAQDGYLVLAAGNDRLWAAVCATLGRSELERDPRFVTTMDRARNQEVLKNMLEAVLKTQPSKHWITAFRAAGVPCEPINGYGAVLTDHQVAAMELIRPLPLPNGTETQTIGSVVAVDGARPPIRNGPPALDGDRQSILAELESDRMSADRSHKFGTSALE